jgi:peptidoglycan/LPS O-acetylase OafA/YrhL
MLIILGAVSMEFAGKGAWLFQAKGLLILGDASYSLYLAHGLLLLGSSKLLLYQLRIQQFITPDGAIIIFFCLCCAMAPAISKWIEKPLIKWVRKFCFLKSATGN